MHQGSLSSELAHLGLSSADVSNEDLELTRAISTSPSGLGVQGAGRGRTGRKSNARNPLGLSTNGTNVRPNSSKHDQNAATNGRRRFSRQFEPLLMIYRRKFQGRSGHYFQGYCKRYDIAEESIRERTGERGRA